MTNNVSAFSTPTAQSPARLLSSRQRSAVLIAGLTFLVVMGVNFVKRGATGDWTQCYVVAAQAMQAGESIHDPRPVAYSYPPAMALLATPLANLSPRESLVAWYFVNAAAMAVVFVCGWRMAGGPGWKQLSVLWTTIFGLTAALALRFWLAPLEKQQTDMVIAALVMSGCLGLLRGRELRAGVWLGAATAMKCTPLLFFPYLLWRGHWRGAGVLLVVAVGLNLLPNLCFPQANGNSYTADWLRENILAIHDKAPGYWRTDVLQNQSLGGLFNRGVQLGLGGSASAVSRDGLADWAAPLVRAMTYGASLCLLGVTAWRFGRPFRRAPTVAAGAESAASWRQLRTSVECAAVMCLMLLLSPMSGKAHYVILFLPCLLIARWTIERPSWQAWLLIGILLVCGPLSAKGLVGKSLGDAALLIGVPTWFVLVALAGLWHILAWCAEAQAATCLAPSRSFRQRLLEDDEVVAPVRVPADADDVVPLLNRQV